MRKFVTLVLASLMLASTPVFAAEAEATALPKELTDLGITSEDLKDVGKGVSDQLTTEEANIMQRYRRYCPRGYRLEAYRIRIGRFVIVRYRCVRYHHRRYDNNQTQGVQTPAVQETIE